MSVRTVLVTGCSSGIGLALAERFLARGWRVLAGLRDTRTVPSSIAGAQTFALDLADPVAIEAAGSRVARLDCLVNNAGYALVGPFASYTPAQMRRQLEVNVVGAAHLTQVLLPALRAARGRVVCISSACGETGMPMNALYCASKFALEGLVESLATELAEHGVQVALVAPGGHRTRFAANFEWGERAVPEGSVEQRQLAGHRALIARLLARPGRGPEAIADAVLRLAERARMPLRTRIGGDAQALYWLRRVLPDALRQRLLASMFRRRLAPPVPAAAEVP